MRKGLTVVPGCLEFLVVFRILLKVAFTSG